MQNNEYDSSAQECVTTDGNADFTVASSSINNATNGSPGAYPSIYQGCHWGDCSSGGLSSDPVEVSNLNLWNGTYTQSGTQVTVNNASYDGTLAAGATATVGFTANGSGSPAPSISCT